MADVIQRCSKCGEYSFSLRRCRLGKINPQSKKAVFEAAEMMGGDYICRYNKYFTVVSNFKGII